MSDTAAAEKPKTQRRRSAPAQPDPAPTLAQKLVQVAQVVDGIEKTGRNDRQNYDFVEAAEVFRQLRAALFEREVLVVPGASAIEHLTWQSGRGATTILSTVHLTYRFVDAPTGDEIAVPWIAEGVDTGGDKGVWKAYTGGLKYVLLQTFLIPTGDDPENDTTTGGGGQDEPAGRSAAVPRIPRERAERIVAQARDAGLDQAVFQAKLHEVGASRVVDLTVDQAETLEAFIAAEAAKSEAQS